MSSNNNDMIRTLTHTKSGSKCQIHDFGATVINFQPASAGGEEVLFMSRLAHLDGSTKAIRGGIPICFPIFGPPSDASQSDMPQHGFARKNVWTYDATSLKDTDDCASVSFHLKVDPTDDKIDGRGTKGLWGAGESSPGCCLTYTVTLTSNSLTCRLKMENTGAVAFPLQALLHTYYYVHNKAALDGTKCNVVGLMGYDKIDKVDSSQNNAASSQEKIVVEGETDHVYNPPKGDHEDKVDVSIGVNLPSRIKCTAKGQVDSTATPVSCVVWNPHETKAKGMSDFANEQYHEMLCVEPGIGLGATRPKLEPGKVATFEMTIQV